jgi:PIN domain nuclease of toxin-antitoxin system
MDLLLDTNIVILAAQNKLPKKADTLLSDEVNRLYYSVAVYWELVIKHSLGKLELGVTPAVLEGKLRAAGYKDIPVTRRHIARLESLPSLHRDPFDRIMVAQALCEDLTLVTTDKSLAAYSGNVLVCDKRGCYA